MGVGQKVGGVLFLDEAYDLDPANNSVGADIFNEIMAAAEDHRDKVRDCRCHLFFRNRS